MGYVVFLPFFRPNFLAVDGIMYLMYKNLKNPVLELEPAQFYTYWEKHENT